MDMHTPTDRTVTVTITFRGWEVVFNSGDLWLYSKVYTDNLPSAMNEMAEFISTGKRPPQSYKS